MELPGTDWLMHWWLLAPRSQAPVWWVTFNEFTAIEFTEEHLLQFVTDQLTDFGKPHPASVKKDVSVLLRMYSSGHTARATFEDKIDCPFRDLGLMQPSVNDAEAIGSWSVPSRRCQAVCSRHAFSISCGVKGLPRGL